MVERLPQRNISTFFFINFCTSSPALSKPLKKISKKTPFLSLAYESNSATSHIALFWDFRALCFYYVCPSSSSFVFSHPMYLVYWNLFTQSLLVFFRRASNQIYWFPISIVPTVRVAIWTVSHITICASPKSVIMARWRRRNTATWEWNVNYLLQILLDISNITTKDITKNNNTIMIVIAIVIVIITTSADECSGTSETYMYNHEDYNDCFFWKN